MNNEKSIFAKLKTYLIFAGPTTFVFFAVVIVPFFYGIYLTFTNWNALSNRPSFIGLTNYIKAWTDEAFISSFTMTINYVIWSVIITNIVAFFLGYVLTSGIRGQNFFRASFFTPNLIGGIVLGFVWRFVFNQGFVQLGGALNIDLLSASWLAETNKAFWALVTVTVWQQSGYMMLIYIAGFMGIPKDLLEAASIDGANGFSKLKSITIPLIVPSFVICLFLTLQRAFMVYDLNVSLNNGGPYRSTQLISMYVYEKAFLHRDYGVGQAQALSLFVIAAIFIMTQVYFTKRLEVEA